MSTQLSNEQRITVLFDDALAKGTLTLDEVNAMKGIILKDKSRTDFFGGAVAGQAELTRKAQELQTATTSLEAQKAQWTKWYGEQSEAVQRINNQLLESQRQTAAAVALAKAYEAPDDEINTVARLGQGTTSLNPNNPPANPSNGTTPNNNGNRGAQPTYMTQDDFYKSERDMAYVMARKDELHAKHFKLFGTIIPNMTEVLSYADQHGAELRASGKDPLEESWRLLHGVTAKEQELAQTERTNWEEQIRADERTKLANSAPLPGAPSTDFSSARVGSHIFASPEGAEEKGGHRERTSLAASALLKRVGERQAGGAQTR